MKTATFTFLLSIFLLTLVPSTAIALGIDNFPEQDVAAVATFASTETVANVNSAISNTVYIAAEKTFIQKKSTQTKSAIDLGEYKRFIYSHTSVVPTLNKLNVSDDIQLAWLENIVARLQVQAQVL